MKLFERSGGHWLFWVSIGYVTAYIVNWYSVPCTRIEYIQAAYVIVVSLPLCVKPLADWINTKCIWEY